MMSGPSDESLEAKEQLTRAAIASGIPQPGYRKSWDIPLKEGAAFIAITVGAFLLLMPSTDPVTDRETPSGIVAGGATNGQNKLLAPGVRQDVLKFKLDLAVRARNHKQTIALITELRAAGSTIAGEVPFYEGRAYMALENWAGAYGAFVTYLNSVGRKGKNYKEAIALFVESERAIKTKRPSETDS
jgi:hypothetical protein